MDTSEKKTIIQSSACFVNIPTRQVGWAYKVVVSSTEIQHTTHIQGLRLFRLSLLKHVKVLICVNWASVT